MLREEFSFPIINKNNTTHLAAVTPSLWRISSLEEYPAGCLDQYLDHPFFEVNGRKGFSTRSFCDMVGDANYYKRDFVHQDGGLFEVENKMDLLWEDFNDDDADDDEDEEEEDLGSKFSLELSGLNHHQEYYCDEKDGDHDDHLKEARELILSSCMEANLKMSETSTTGLVVSKKRKQMILVLKVLMKKLLLLHKMGRFMKYRS